MAHYDAIGVGIPTHDFLGVAPEPPTLDAKHRLTDWVEQGGGPVATALVTMARLGRRVCLVGSVGTDHYGERIIRDLQHEGVATDGVHVLPGTSHRAFILVEPSAGRRTVWAHKNRPGYDALTLDRTLITSAPALLLDTYMPATALVAAEWMRDDGGIVLLDAERCTPETMHLLPYCTIIIASQDFARLATSLATPAQATTHLAAHTNCPTIVTAGNQGCWCAMSNQTVVHVPAFSVEPVIDTTGAGDVFHGAFLVAWLDGADLIEAARFASAAAALKCRHVGGRAGIPTRQEIQLCMG